MLFKSYNQFHLGDNTYHLHLLRKLSDSYHENQFYHYVLPEYIKELEYQIVGYENKIKILDISLMDNSACNSWIATDNFFFNDREYFNYNEMYIRWFNYYCSKIGLENKCNDVIFDYSIIKERHNSIKERYDILFINSDGHSGQFPSSQNELTNLAHTLSQKYSIITTQKIDGFPCTRDFNYNLVDIGALAINCRYLISIFTSPIIMSINKWSVLNLEKVFSLDKSGNFYNYKNWFQIKNINEFNIIIKELM